MENNQQIWMLEHPMRVYLEIIKNPELLQFMKTVQPKEDKGFIFSVFRGKDKKLMDQIESLIEADFQGHSGCSYAMALREIQFYAQNNYKTAEEIRDYHQRTYDYKRLTEIRNAINKAHQELLAEETHYPDHIENIINILDQNITQTNNLLKTSSRV